MVSGQLLLPLKPVFFTVSISLNILFAVTWLWPTPHHHHHLVTSREAHEGWTRNAAMAAEKAAQFDCNDNGDLYVDTVSLEEDEGNTEDLRCECYECFAGPRCADAVPNCTADVSSGDPLMFAPYWKENAEASAVVIPGWYRAGYQLIESSTAAQISPALEREIRKLHSIVGNAVVDDKYIVVATGSMQLLNAAVVSLSPTSGDPASVVAAVPYYGSYRTQTEYFETSHYAWAGDAHAYAEQTGASDDNSSSVEFVTSPNNPDGAMRSAVVNGSNAATIFDLAYYWPHFTAITRAHDDDVMLFTLSKVTGHAGSRIGWAIVKESSVLAKLKSYIQTNIVGVSHEAQLRATQLLRAVNRGYADEGEAMGGSTPLSLPAHWYASEGRIFHYAYKKMRDRWERLSLVLEQSSRFALQHLEPTHCGFFNETTGPSPAYAWIRCTLDDDQDCAAVLSQAGITGRAGTTYGASGKYVRLSLIKRDSVFQSLIDHFTALVVSPQESLPFTAQVA